MREVIRYLDRREGRVFAMVVCRGHETAVEQDGQPVQQAASLYRGVVRGDTPESVLVDYILEYGQPVRLDTAEAEMVRREWPREVLPDGHPWRDARSRSPLLLPWIAEQVGREWRDMVTLHRRVRQEDEAGAWDADRRSRFRAAMRPTQAGHLSRMADGCDLCGHPLASLVRSLASQVEAAVSRGGPFGPAVQLAPHGGEWRISGVPTLNGIEGYRHRAEAILAALAGTVSHGATCSGPLFVEDRGIL